MILKGIFTLFPKKMGGRQTPCWKGYRPMYIVGGKGGTAIIQSMEGEKLHPGESAKVEMEVLVPEQIEDNVEIGDAIPFSEGIGYVGWLSIEGIVRD